MTSTINLPDAPDDQRRILEAGGVACWESTLEIDTYAPAAPDHYPAFLDRRVYQGSSGRIYPMPITDRIGQEKAPRAWRAIHLENQWVRLVLIPELGGRIHFAVDKTRDYDFFYRNNVIKPALVGLGGPWISGGVEFNWPQHHRPATYLPVETSIDREDDGSVTVWHSDLDQLQRMRGTHGIRLRGDSALIELDVRLVNRTDVPQTFLWWANVAARSHEHYQAFFPTDVGYVADHARRAITAFPAADRPYYGVDYPALAADEPGADRIDRYSNIPVPTSYMITDTVDDFFGGYDHSVGAGFVHWADRAVAPGKKLWTWGDGEVGHAWDRLLTDGDGPYVELMAGVFTDNQPDFTWLLPGETKRFRQYWYPIQDIGPAVQATREAAIAVDVDGNRARIGVASTSIVSDVSVRLRRADELLAEWQGDIAPGRPFIVEADLADAATRDDLTVDVIADGATLVAWSAHPTGEEPWVATEPAPAEAIAAVDELIATGTHLVQYRHPTRAAEPYFEEALRRDPGDARARLALARLAYDRGEFDDALAHLDVARERLTARNLNPVHGDVSLLRGLILERLGRLGEAADAFGKAFWDGALALPASLGRARIALRQGDARRSLEFADDALDADASSGQAVAARIVALRALGRTEVADALIVAARHVDPLDPLMSALDDALDPLDARTLVTIAYELHRMGDAQRAIGLLRRATESHPSGSAFVNAAPVAAYALAAILDAAGDSAGATDALALGRTLSPLLAFPAGLDDLAALEQAVRADATDARALGYLGSWLLDAGRMEAALRSLRAATAAQIDDPVVWRNLAIAIVNSGGDPEEADECYAAALGLSPADPRLVYERDQLAAIRAIPATLRLAAIEDAGDGVLVRDDLAIAYTGLLVDADRAEDALRLLRSRRFQPFEGGEGQVIAVWDRASCVVARALRESGDAAAALGLLESGIRIPEHLGEGRHPADIVAERMVLIGDCLADLGRDAEAVSAWQQASIDSGPLAAAGHVISARDYWVGIGRVRLGEADGAAQVWTALEERAAALESAPDRADYFATSLPELLLFRIDTAERRREDAAELRVLAAAGRAH